MLKRFLLSGRTGFYLAVLEEGDVAAGDPIIPVRRDEDAIAKLGSPAFVVLNNKERVARTGLVGHSAHLLNV